MKRFLFTLAASVAAAGCAAQQIPPAEWLTPDRKPNREAPFWKVPEVKGLVFLGSEKQVVTNGLAVSGIQIQDLPILNTASFKRRVAPFIGKPMNYETMKSLHVTIVTYMRERGRPLMDAIYPPQEVTGGVLQVAVVQARLGQVVWLNPSTNGIALKDDQTPLSGPHVHKEYLQRSFRTKPGEPIDGRKIEADLDWLSRSPFRDVGTGPGDVIYAPTKTTNQNSADIYLRVEETKPWDVFVGYENTGSKATDFNRVLAGFDIGSPLGSTEHLFNYQFQADPALEHLRAHSANYAIQLPWHHTLRLFGYYLDVEADIDAGQATGSTVIAGRSYQTSVRYEVSLPRWRGLQHEISAGLDFKRIGNSVQFNGLTAQDSPWDVFQPTIGYVGAVADPMGRTVVSASGFYSPGELTGDNSLAAFARVNPDASPDYLYARFQLERIQKLRLRWQPDDPQLVFRAGAQVSNGNLLPSEQLGLGGRATIHGFPEREVNADEGWYVGAEIQSPAIHLAKWKGRPVKDELRFVGFYNFGVGSTVTPQPGETDRYLASVGVGFRYRLSRRIDLQANVAKRLRESGFVPTSGLAADLSARIVF